MFSLRTIITQKKTFIRLEKVVLRWSIIPNTKYWNCQHPPMRFKDQLNSVSVPACARHKLSILQINKFRISLRVLRYKRARRIRAGTKYWRTSIVWRKIALLCWFSAVCQKILWEPSQQHRVLRYKLQLRCPYFRDHFK